MVPLSLRSVHAIGYFDEMSPSTEPEFLEDDDIKCFIYNFGKDSNLVEDALNGLRTNMSIFNPSARVFQLALDYDRRMASVGYEDFKVNNRKKSVMEVVHALYLRH